MNLCNDEIIQSTRWIKTYFKFFVPVDIEINVSKMVKPTYPTVQSFKK